MKGGVLTGHASLEVERGQSVGESAGESVGEFRIAVARSLRLRAGFQLSAERVGGTLAQRALHFPFGRVG